MEQNSHLYNTFTKSCGYRTFCWDIEQNNFQQNKCFRHVYSTRKIKYKRFFKQNVVNTYFFDVFFTFNNA